MLKRFAVGALVAIIASFVCLFVADNVLFALNTIDGSYLMVDSVEADDVEWWKSVVGTSPRTDGAKVIEPPEPVNGRTGTWYHPTGGAGSPGLNGAPPLAPTSGLIAYSVNTKCWIVSGRALASIDTCGYRMGVALPCVMLERHFVGPQGVATPSIDESEWHTNLRWAGLLANVGLCGGLFCVPLALFSDVRIARVLRGRCFKCAYILMQQQTICSECGSARRRWI